MEAQSSTTIVINCIAAVALSLLVWSLASKILIANQNQLKNVPGPWFSRFSRLPLKLAAISGTRYRYVHSLHEKYGPFVRIAPNEVAVADIEAHRQIHRIGSNFRKNPGFYQVVGADQLDDTTCGVFMLWDPKLASSRRRLFQQAGTKKNVADWEPQVIELTQMMTRKIRKDLEKGKCNINKWFTLLASDVMGELSFGHSFDSVKNEQNGEMIDDIESIMPVVGLKVEMQWLYELFMLTPFSRKHHRRLQNFKRYGADAVASTRAAHKGASKTLFSRMIPEDGSQTLPDSLVVKEAVNVIVAGVDTTSVTLTYIVYSILQNHEMKQKLIDEVRGVAEFADAQQLEQLPYLNNVIQEAMRLYPAVPGALSRVVPPEGAVFGEIALPAGTIVASQAYTLHTNLRVFPDPLKFIPDRWLNPTPEMKEHFIAWGGQVRSCVGQNIARLELLHAIFRLFRDCGQIKLAPETTKASMEVVDYFNIKPRSEVCMIMPE